MKITTITDHDFDDGTSLVVLRLSADDGSDPVEHRFGSREEAASFAAAAYESEEFSREERLGPFGIEWEREQNERQGR